MMAAFSILSQKKVIPPKLFTAKFLTFRNVRLCKNQIMQYLQNCKCDDINQGHFREPLQGSSDTTKY